MEAAKLIQVLGHVSRVESLEYGVSGRFSGQVDHFCTEDVSLIYNVQGTSLPCTRPSGQKDPEV